MTGVTPDVPPGKDAYDADLEGPDRVTPKM